MKIEVMWRWQIRARDAWVVTTHHATEEAIRSEHPEAVRVDGTRLEIEAPDSAQEKLDSRFGGL